MLIRLNQNFVDVDGKAMLDRRESTDLEGNKTVVDCNLTLYRTIVLSLSDPAAKIESDTKIKYYELLVKVITCKEKMQVELESEDVTAIKNAIKAKFVSPLVVGEAMEMLENKKISITQ